jgi:hypothetical protein
MASAVLNLPISLLIDLHYNSTSSYEFLYPHLYFFGRDLAYIGILTTTSSQQEISLEKQPLLIIITKTVDQILPIVTLTSKDI